MNQLTNLILRLSYFSLVCLKMKKMKGTSMSEDVFNQKYLCYKL